MCGRPLSSRLIGSLDSGRLETTAKMGVDQARNRTNLCLDGELDVIHARRCEARFRHVGACFPLFFQTHIQSGALAHHSARPWRSGWGAVRNRHNLTLDLRFGVPVTRHSVVIGSRESGGGGERIQLGFAYADDSISSKRTAEQLR
jgi:hypothetical protein